MDGCNECGGPLVPLGQMGHLFFFRCRNCGNEQAEEVAVIQELCPELFEEEIILE